MDHWGYNPPAHVTLAARYGMLKQKPTLLRPTSMEEIAVLGGEFGLGAPNHKMPQELSDAVAWAETKLPKKRNH